jgi:hypothetical protein
MTKAQLFAAAQTAGIDPERAGALWEALQREDRGAPGTGFNATSVAYYFGGFLIIGAMTFFMAEGWIRLGAGFVFATSVVYAVVLAWLGVRLFRGADTRIPGGILVTAAVCMAPLGIWAFESMLHVWQQGNPGTYSRFYVFVHGSYIWMELGTIAASAVALYFVRFPLITLPAAFAAWFLSMDSVNDIFGTHATLNQALWVALGYGIAMLAISILIDRRTSEDFAFWGYLYGTIAFSSGIALLWTDQFHRFLFLLTCLGMIAMSIVLVRRVLLIFGAAGVAGYLGFLAFGIFKTSLLFPFVLTAIGLAIVAAGIYYQRHETQIRARVLAVIPAKLAAALPTSRSI